jgi:hypothetical protein
MLFYRVLEPGTGRLLLVDNQGQAKKIDKNFDPAVGVFDFPAAKKEEAKEVLQDLIDRIQAAEKLAESHAKPAAPEPAGDAPATGEARPGALDPSAVIDYIFDEADNNEIAAIMEAIATRFREGLRQFTAALAAKSDVPASS